MRRARRDHEERALRRAHPPQRVVAPRVALPCTRAARSCRSTGRRGGGQPALVSCTSRQWRRARDPLERGEQLHRVRVAEQHHGRPRSRSPYTQRGLVVLRSPTRQPSSIRAPAVLVGVERPRAQRRRPTPASRCVRASCGAPSPRSRQHRRRREARGEHDARPPPPAPGPATAPPSISRGRRTWILERRIGSSIQRWAAIAGTSDARSPRRARGRQRPPRRGGEDEHRPVPDVPRVGHAADQARRARGEAARRRASAPRWTRRRAARRRRASAAARAGPGRRCRRRSAWRRRRSRRRRPTRPRRPRRRPSERPSSAIATIPPSASSHARAAGEKYACSGARGGLADRVGQRHDGDRAHREQQAPVRAASRRAPRDHEQHQRPREVELLLDGQRPEVVQRPVLAGGEVVDGAGREPPVHRVDAGRHHVAGHRSAPTGDSSSEDGHDHGGITRAPAASAA